MFKGLDMWRRRGPFTVCGVLSLQWSSKKKQKTLLHYVFILTAVTEMFSLFVLFDVFSGFRTMKGYPDLLPILKDLEFKGQNA